MPPSQQFAVNFGLLPYSQRAEHNFDYVLKFKSGCLKKEILMQLKGMFPLYCIN